MIAHRNSLSSKQKEFLDLFKKEIALPLTDKPSIIAATSLLTAISQNKPLLFTGPDIEKSIKLCNLFTKPDTGSSRVNIIALTTLRHEMKKILIEQVDRIKSIYACSLLLEEIPTYQVHDFLQTITNVKNQYLQSGSSSSHADPSKQAFVHGLAFALAGATTSLSTLEKEKALEDWTCPIKHTNLLLQDDDDDIAYFFKEGVPTTLYNKKALINWVFLAAKMIYPIIKAFRYNFFFKYLKQTSNS